MNVSRINFEPDASSAVFPAQAGIQLFEPNHQKAGGAVLRAVEPISGLTRQSSL